jgi:hypothetical protein
MPLRIHIYPEGAVGGDSAHVRSQGVWASPVERFVFDLSHGLAWALWSLCQGSLALRLHVHLSFLAPQLFGNEDVKPCHHSRSAWGVRHSGISLAYHPLPTDLSPSVGAHPGTMDAKTWTFPSHSFPSLFPPSPPPFSPPSPLYFMWFQFSPFLLVVFFCK